MKLPIPRGVQRRLEPFVKRGEAFLREWEWTWTKAFVFAMILSFFAMTVLAVIPSWMLYFAEGELGWDRGPTFQDRVIVAIRDLIVNGWTFTWTLVFIVAAYFLQKARRRVRGEKQSERYSGGYR